jgi:hypothetical protein
MQPGWRFITVPDLDEPPSVCNQAVAFESTWMWVKGSRLNSEVVRQVRRVRRHGMHDDPVLLGWFELRRQQRPTAHREASKAYFVRDE